MSYHLKDRPKWIVEWHSRDKFPEGILLCGEKKGLNCLYLNTDLKRNLSLIKNKITDKDFKYIIEN